MTFFQVIMLINLGETSPFYLLVLDVINWFMFGHELHIYYIYEPRCEKTGLRGFRSCPTQTGLYNNRRWLEACKFGLRKLGDCTIYVAKTKALISCAVTVQVRVRMSKSEKRNKKIYFDIQSSFFFFVGLR